MTRLHRITTEVFAPPALGALSLVILDCPRKGILEAIAWIPSYLVFAYLFATIPSILYAWTMELWFQRRLHHRFGSIATISFSAAVGTVVGAFLNIFLQFQLPLCLCGGSVGALIGLYVTRNSSKPLKPDASNSAIASRFQIGGPRRGADDRER